MTRVAFKLVSLGTDVLGDEVPGTMLRYPFLAELVC